MKNIFNLCFLLLTLIVVIIIKIYLKPMEKAVTTYKVAKVSINISSGIYALKAIQTGLGMYIAEHGIYPQTISVEELKNYIPNLGDLFLTFENDKIENYSYDTIQYTIVVSVKNERNVKLKATLKGIWISYDTGNTWELK